MFRTLALSLLMTGFVSWAQAQPVPREPAPVSGFNPTASEVHEQEVLGASDKVHGVISIPDARAANLIQPAGQTWRDYRRGPLLWITSVLVLGTLAALALFYRIRGRVLMPGKRGGGTVLRFGSFERFMHWLTASSWCVLALSGLNNVVGRRVLLPVLGEESFALLSGWLKYAHNFVAFPFTLGVILMLLVWVRHNIPARIDVDWFLAGGGIVGNKHPPSGKFNGGQKAVFWIVVLGGGSLALTGLALLFPFTVTDVTGMQVIQVVHGGIALLMIAAMLGHIYIGTVGMEGAIDAMATGQVDRNWAALHHDLWLAEVDAKSGSPAHPAE